MVSAAIFGQKGDDDNLSGEGGDGYTEGHAGNDVISDGLGSDDIWAGSGSDKIPLQGNDGSGVGFDEAYGERGRDNIDGYDVDGYYLLIYGEGDHDTITRGATQTIVVEYTEVEE